MNNKSIVLYVVLLLISACTAFFPPSQQSRVKHNSVSSAQFEQQFLIEMNKVRAVARICGGKKYPAAAALTLNAKLTSASYEHSLDMSENQFLEHISSNGDTLVERMQEVNYVWSAVGENLAYNQKTIQQVITDWLSSPGHCSNLMSSDYTQVGVAVVNRYWTQVYATPK